MKRSISNLSIILIGLLFALPLIVMAAAFPVAVGGTGQTTLSSGLLLYGAGTAPLQSIATTSVTCTGSASCTAFTVIGASPITINASAGAGSWPFTPGTNFGTAVQSTSTPISDSAGLFASSTNQFVNENIWGLFSLKATSSALLSTDSTGLVIATTSIGTNLLTGNLGTINTTAPLGGGGAFNKGTTLTLTCTTCTGWPWNVLTNFASTTNATTTPLWQQTGVFASSTSQFVNANIWGNLVLTGTSSRLLATDANGQVTATSSIGVNYLTGILPIANGGTNASSFGTSNGILAYNGTALVNFAGFTLTSSLLTATNASTTALSATGYLQVPAAASPAVGASGQFAINTTTASTSLRWYDGTATRVVFSEIGRSINLASSTLVYQGGFSSAGGTTTLLVMNNDRPMTLLHFYCKTNSGVATVQFSTGSATTTTTQCTSAGVDSGVLASNNTWTIYQNFWLSVGGTASVPNNTVITYFLRNDAD